MTPETLAPIFAAMLAEQTPLFDREEQWPAARLRCRTYVGEVDYPELLATSVRAVVFKAAKVVVVRQTDGQRHINPGGRIEPGESLEGTVRREVLEETGWTLGALKPLGFHHFQPLGERPVGLAHRWCDFIQPIFVAEAASYHPGARDRAQLEAGSRLTPIARAALEVPPRDAALLRAAVVRRGRP